MQSIKVCHLTSNHSPEDIRIFHKECVSLAKAGYHVYLVERGETYDKNGVHIIGIGSTPQNPIKRMKESAKKVYQTALSVDADIYHFHDPELLPYGLKLKRKGKRVIFDSHEDFPAQIKDKPWLASWARNTVSSAYEKYETHVVKRIDAVIAATPHIAEKFRRRAKKCSVINNYPKFDDIAYHDTPLAERSPIVCYAGGINELRGETIMIKAMENVEGTLIIAGDHEKQQIGTKVKYVGKLDRAGVNELYGNSVIGLCILKPIENYYYSQPIKMYEYMAAGIPFICSDFPGWKKIADESGAGICVDPMRIDAISQAISDLLTGREKAQEMGEKGRNYVKANCTWRNEEKALISLYQSIWTKE